MDKSMKKWKCGRERQLACEEEEKKEYEELIRIIRKSNNKLSICEQTLLLT